MRAGYFRTRCDSTRVPSRRVLNSLLPKALLVQARHRGHFRPPRPRVPEANPPLIHHDNEIRTLDRESRCAITSVVLPVATCSSEA